MKAIADSKSRVALGRIARPGDVFDISRLPTGEIKLTPLVKAGRKSGLVRHGGYLMLRTSRTVSPEEEARAIQEDSL